MKCAQNSVKHNIFCSEINEDADTSRSLIENISLLHVNEHLLKGLSHKIDFKNFDKKLHNWA